MACFRSVGLTGSHFLSRCRGDFQPALRTSAGALGRSLCIAATLSLLAGAVLTSHRAAAFESTLPATSSTAAAEAGGLLAFDIPVQPLASALDAYGVTAHREVLYDGRLAIGRQSAGVRGSFTPEAALKRLLEGTGLSPRYMAADAFVLVADDDRSSLQTNTAPPDVVTRYYGRIQASLRRALCANIYTRPGDYRVAIGFRIGPSGIVSRAELLSSSGDHDRDTTIAKAVSELAIGVAPPQGFAQPVILIITPQSQASVRDCEVEGVRSVGGTP